MRATFDDFKKPWRDAREKGYDRLSGEGYYRNAPEFESARTLLLALAGPEGSGRVALCAHDPLTGEDHRGVTIDAPRDAVLVDYTDGELFLGQGTQLSRPPQNVPSRAGDLGRWVHGPRTRTA